METDLRHKVYAYITHGRRLLLFNHRDFPEAGIQVPGGTMEEGEDPEAAVMREAFEETGLTGLRLASFLGEVMVPLPEFDQVHHRRYYHLIQGGNPPESWYHDETDPSDGSPAPIRFELFWAELSEGVPELSGDLGQMLPALLHDLKTGG